MNVENLTAGFQCLSHYGVTLPTEKYVVIYNSLIVLRAESHYNSIYLWGVIRGLDADYYVAYGYEDDPLNRRTFFYSLNGLNWLLLPVPSPDDVKFASMCSSRFQGDPKFATQIDFDDPSLGDLEKKTEEAMVNDEEETLGEETDLIKAEGKIKEEDRLAAIVHTINEEAFIVPRGALYKRHDGKVVENKGFEGLTLLEGDEMRSYLHCRFPQEKWNTNLLTRSDYNYGVDFLDTIDSNKPDGMWIMRLFDGNKIIFLHHLAWPGFVFCHLVTTSFYFSFYYGDGKKNLDIPFML